MRVYEFFSIHESQEGLSMLSINVVFDMLIYSEVSEFTFIR